MFHLEHLEHSENVLIIEWERLGYLVCVCCVGRAMQLRPTLIEDFKTLVAEQGMSKDTIVLKKNKGTLTTQTNAQPRFYSDQMIIFLALSSGECVPGEQFTPEPQIQVKTSAHTPETKTISIKHLLASNQKWHHPDVVPNLFCGP